MGYYPHKTIGWVIEAPRTTLNQPALDALHRGDHSYRSFYDWLEQHSSSSASQHVLQRHPYADALTTHDIAQFVHVVADTEYDHSDTVYAVFYPMLLTPYAFPAHIDPIGDFHQGDSPFNYAELERLFPDGLTNLQPKHYGFNHPVFPSEYEIIQAQQPYSYQAYSLLGNKYTMLDEYRVLYHLLHGNEDKADVFSSLTECNSAAQVAATYQLAPPAELFAFAHYLNLFTDEIIPHTMHPGVVYYWS